MWKNFKEYVIFRENSGDVSFNMNHDEAMKWVLSVLGIMDDYNPSGSGKQQEQINDALSSPLSSYPEKLENLGNQLQIKNAPNYQQIAALLANPEKTTVSKLVSTLSMGKTPQKVLDDDEKDG